jgi:hypothetical protein
MAAKEQGDMENEAKDRVLSGLAHILASSLARRHQAAGEQACDASCEDITESGKEAQPQ